MYGASVHTSRERSLDHAKAVAVRCSGCRQYRLKELEAAAEQLQAALLAELDGPPQAGGTASKKKSKAKKGKKKQVRLAASNVCRTRTKTLGCSVFCQL